MKNKLILTTTLVGALVLAVGLPLIPRVTVAATVCPPASADWSGNAQFTTHTFNTVYNLNNDQWNEQPTSSQTIWADDTAGTWGLCVFQPSTGNPPQVTSFPNLHLPLPGDNWNSYSTITDTFNINTGGSAVSNWQWMADVWVHAKPGGSNPIEIEVVENRHEAQSPAGTHIGTATLGSNVYDVYQFSGGSDNHLAYAFITQTNETSGTSHIKSALNWLHTNESLATSEPLDQIDTGFEIKNIQNVSGGVATGFKVNSYSTTVQ